MHSYTITQEHTTITDFFFTTEKRSPGVGLADQALRRDDPESLLRDCVDDPKGSLLPFL